MMMIMITDRSIQERRYLSKEGKREGKEGRSSHPGC
jgi:hypothetical protein